ncbi:unnamed protein product [Prorocentrum cordatum]|uniref:EF-hand domain-containing protein n=2 Tax=Prorocentrum cordatum TaxID=2364126 RepID=A0ABN9Y435_9DINO|nr:unnamed protein product [Polarella glacialis]
MAAAAGAGAAAAGGGHAYLVDALQAEVAKWRGVAEELRGRLRGAEAAHAAAQERAEGAHAQALQGERKRVAAFQKQRDALAAEVEDVKELHARQVDALRRSAAGREAAQVDLAVLYDRHVRQLQLCFEAAAVPVLRSCRQGQQVEAAALQECVAQLELGLQAVKMQRLERRRVLQQTLDRRACERQGRSDRREEATEFQQRRAQWLQVQLASMREAHALELEAFEERLLEEEQTADARLDSLLGNEVDAGVSHALRSAAVAAAPGPPPPDWEVERLRQEAGTQRRSLAEALRQRGSWAGTPPELASARASARSSREAVGASAPGERSPGRSPAVLQPGAHQEPAAVGEGAPQARRELSTPRRPGARQEPTAVPPRERPALGEPAEAPRQPATRPGPLAVHQEQVATRGPPDAACEPAARPVQSTEGAEAEPTPSGGLSGSLRSSGGVLFGGGLGASTGPRVGGGSLGPAAPPDGSGGGGGFFGPQGLMAAARELVQELAAAGEPSNLSEPAVVGSEPGDPWEPTAAGREPSGLEPGASELVAAEARRSIVGQLFDVLDTDGDGLLSQQEMEQFARHHGFEGSDDEWAKEFQLLCGMPIFGETSRGHRMGVPLDRFRTLVDDQSEAGLFCSHEELCQLLLELRQGQPQRHDEAQRSGLLTPSPFEAAPYGAAPHGGDTDEHCAAPLGPPAAAEPLADSRWQAAAGQQTAHPPRAAPPAAGRERAAAWPAVAAREPPGQAALTWEPSYARGPGTLEARAPSRASSREPSPTRDSSAPAAAWPLVRVPSAASRPAAPPLGPAAAPELPDEPAQGAGEPASAGREPPAILGAPSESAPARAAEARGAVLEVHRRQQPAAGTHPRAAVPTDQEARGQGPQEHRGLGLRRPRH